MPSRRFDQQPRKTGNRDFSGMLFVALPATIADDRKLDDFPLVTPLSTSMIVKRVLH